MSTETRTVEVHARRWFEQTNGNTYHAVRVVIDGETVAVVPFTYGYGTHYLHTAGLAIIEAGHPFGDLLEPAYGTANDGPSSRAYSLSSLFRWRAGDERPSFTDDDGTRWERADYVQDVPRRTDLVPDEWADAHAETIRAHARDYADGVAVLYGGDLADPDDVAGELRAQASELDSFRAQVDRDPTDDERDTWHDELVRIAERIEDTGEVNA